MAVYITGDCHGNYEHIKLFCKRMKTSKKDDLMIILGDVAANFLGNKRDIKNKEYLSSIPIKFLCIHGNHDKRPEKCEGYELSDYLGGKVWVHYDYPTIMFAKDGEIFNINGKKTIVIGGAYSVDKYFRLQMHWTWHADEQPDEKIKMFVENQLEKNNWNVDVVLSHTVPYRYRPVEFFLPTVDQSQVDTSTEEWLEEIERKLTYKKWYAGHYHCEKRVDKIEIMYNNFDEFCEH